MARKAKTARTERASASDQIAQSEPLATSAVASALALSEPTLETTEAFSDPALSESLATADVVAASASSEPLETLETPLDSASSESPAEAVASAPGEVESSVTLVGATVLMRSSLWMNGKRTVAGILTGVEETNFGLGDALAIVSVTAFPPGSPSRTMGDVPLYTEDPGEKVVPAAWLRP